MKELFDSRKKHLEDMDYSIISENGREYGVIINPDNRKWGVDEIPDLEVYLVWWQTEYCRKIEPIDDVIELVEKGYYDYIKGKLNEY